MAWGHRWGGVPGQRTSSRPWAARGADSAPRRLLPPRTGGRREGEGRKGRLPGVSLLPLPFLRGQVAAEGAGEGSAAGGDGRWGARGGVGASPARSPRGRLRAVPRRGRMPGRAARGCFSHNPFRCARALSGPPRPPGASSEWRRRCRGCCRPGPPGSLRAVPGTADPRDTWGNILSLTLTPRP